VAPANDRAPRPNGSSAPGASGRLPPSGAGCRVPAGGLATALVTPCLADGLSRPAASRIRRRDDNWIEATLEFPPDGADTSVPGLRFASKARRPMMG
jgi:hypothetical protein